MEHDLDVNSDTLMVLLKEFFENVFEKKSAGDKNMQTFRAGNRE